MTVVASDDAGYSGPLARATAVLTFPASHNSMTWHDRLGRNHGYLITPRECWFQYHHKPGRMPTAKKQETKVACLHLTHA